MSTFSKVFPVLWSLLVAILVWRIGWAAVQSTCKEHGHVVLTFDFGPSSSTGRLLDILWEKKIPATFHVSVEHLRNITLVEYVRRAHSEGHNLGIMIPETPLWNEQEELPEDDAAFTRNVIQQITIASNWITAITGTQPRYVRFSSKKQIPVSLRRTIEQQLGLTITKARVEIRDENNKMDSIWNSLIKGLANGTPQTNSFIIRQRDSMANSVASVEKIVEFVQERGYKVVPMDVCVPPRPIK